MTLCLEKSCSFGLQCISSVNVYQPVCVRFFLIGFEDGICYLTILVADHCLSFHFEKDTNYLFL